MTIAVCTLGCSRKLRDVHSWETLTQLEGDYRLYVNWELQNPCAEPVGEERDFLISRSQRLSTLMAERGHDFYLDTWHWGNYATSLASDATADLEHWKPREGWRKRPKFDQDQARLSSIVTARNMCIDFAMQTDSSHLLFVDADIVPPLDIIPKLLEVGHDAVGGYVKGRGVHSECEYVFGEKRRYHQNGFQLIEAEHGNIGYCLLSRKLIENVRFRYGTSRYPDGRESMISDDPAFHLDVFMKFGHWMVIRADAVGRHVGELKAEEVSQF